jgi:hypothetical protein
MLMGVFQIFINKIVVITIVLFLFLLTNVSVFGKFNVVKINDGYNVFFVDEDVPFWNVGYSWSYKGEVEFSENLNLYLDIIEACFVVTDIDDGMYSMNFGGDISGFVDMPGTPFTLEIQELSGNILLTVSNLGLKEIDLFITGVINIQSVKYPAKESIKIV